MSLLENIGLAQREVLKDQGTALDTTYAIVRMLSEYDFKIKVNDMAAIRAGLDMIKEEVKALIADHEEDRAPWEYPDE